MVGPANRTHSRTSASQAPQSPQSSAARSSSTMDVDPPQRVLGGDFSGNDSRPESKEAFRLAQVAAALEVAFWAPCGQQGDSELLPTALAILNQVHSKGIIHGDLRPPNFIVNELDTVQGVQKTIFLLDFSHCDFDASEEAQHSEVCNLKRLFEAM
ncbi:g10717 [Coccomyxa elongata]